VQDGDVLTMRASAGEEGGRVGFGEVSGEVLEVKC